MSHLRRRWTLVLALAAFVGLTPLASASEAAYTGVLTKRVALVVASFDRSLPLYRDILGFQLNGISVDRPDSYGYAVFGIDRSIQTRFATFNSGPNQIRSLALVELPGYRPAEGTPHAAALVLNANGRLDEILTRVRALGLPVVPEHPLPSPAQGVGREAAFSDPDGHLIVLYQFPRPVDPPNKQ